MLDIEKRRYNALIILGIVLPFLLIVFLSAVFLSTGQSYVYRLVCSRFLIWAVLGLMILYARLAEVQRFIFWSEERYHWSFYCIWVVGLYMFAFTAGIMAHIPQWLGLHEKNEMLQKILLVMRQYPIVLVFTVITAGITEELIFRAYMIPRLSLFFQNKTIPVIISSTLFSAIHLGYKNVGELIFALCFGLVFGYHYQKYRNIKVLIFVHAFWDLLACLSALHYKTA